MDLLEENDATPTFAEGDEEAMKNAHPDFIGFNYYSTATVQKAAADDELDPGADQQSAVVKQVTIKDMQIQTSRRLNLVGKLIQMVS